MVELLSPIALHDAQRRHLTVFAAVGFTGRAGLLRRSIGDNRSTIRVELLSPIALHDAIAAVSYGFRGCWFYRSRGLIAPIDWGQSIYHGSAL